MIERVAGTITRYSMIAPGERVGVAVSGGADSVCLLRVLKELSARWNLRLEVLHLEHGIRGEASREDAAFVGEMAASLGLPFHLRDVDVAAASREAGDNLEQAGREARRAFFREFLDSGALDRVALGHTRSDQAETILFRFLRGAGTAGLAGIRPVTSDGFVRPLLGVHRSEVEGFLRERGIAWREDASNFSLDHARNRIRHHLLPELIRDWNPGLAATLANMAEWARGEEEYWEGELARLAPEHITQCPPAVLLRSDRLHQLPAAVARRLLRRAVEIVKGDLRSIDFAHIDAVLLLASHAEGHGRLQVPGVDIIRSFEWLRLAPPGLDTLYNRNYRLELPVPGRAELPAGGAISVELIENHGDSEMFDSIYNESVGFLDCERISGSLAVRNWRPGDQYQPLGHFGEERIKQLFQQARVPLWERRHWPILTGGDQILWARRFGPAARFVARPETRRVLVVRETSAKWNL